MRLRLPAGSRYTLVAATSALDREIAELAAAIPATARVWGTLYSGAAGDPNAYIVVTAILPNTEEPVVAGRPTPTLTRTSTPTPTPTPTPQPLMAVARFDMVNLFAGPGSTYGRGGQLRAGMRCPITGRNAAATWIRIECTDGGGAGSSAGTTGWIEPRFVIVMGSVDDAPVATAPQPTPSPTATPAPTATAQPYVFRGWRALYFANAQLRGPPAFVDDVAEISANWEVGAPRAGMPADYFSIAFERTVYFAPGYYFFTAEADDGLRFLLDGVALLDQWNNTGAQTFRLGMPLAGAHDLRVEYNEVSGAGRLRFEWQAGSTAMRWQAGYAGLPNTPGGVVTRQESEANSYRLDYNWGIGSPTGAPAANWTARWVGTFRFEAGNYIFQAQGRDGIRVTLDGTVVLDKWNDGYGDLRNRFIGVGAGDHTVTVDYYDRVGDASIRVWWYRDTTFAPQ